MIIVKDHDGDWAAVYQRGEKIIEGHISTVEHNLLYNHFGVESREVPTPDPPGEYPIYLDEVCPDL